MVNALLQRIAAPPDHVLEGPQQLYAIRAEPSLAIDRFTTRPEIALAEAALLTNGRGEPALNAELASPGGSSPAPMSMRRNGGCSSSPSGASVSR